MSKEYDYNGKKYILITEGLDKHTGCSSCSFIEDVKGCYSMEACAVVPNSYFALCDGLKEHNKQMILPVEASERKCIPITTGVLDYFPLAIAEVAKCSWAGNQQHHPGTKLHWDKTKSTDHADCLARHLVDRGKFDTDGQRHSAKLAWRALALLELELEKEKE